MRDEVVDAKDAEAEEKGDKAVDDEAEKMIADREIFVRVQTFRRVPPVLPCNFCHPDLS